LVKNANKALVKIPSGLGRLRAPQYWRYMALHGVKGKTLQSYLRKSSYIDYRLIVKFERLMQREY